jgi:TolB-like protein
MRKLAIIGPLCLMLLTLGCRGSMQVYYINPNFDFSYIKRVAVLPFDNLTQERNAEDIVRHLVINELLATELVEVVVPGEAIAAMNSMGIKSVSTLSEKQIKALGKALNVQAVIYGAIEKYEVVKERNISEPEVTITMIMAETTTGGIVWSVTRTGGRAGFMSRHFGARTETLSEAVLKVVRESIRTLFEY